MSCRESTVQSARTPQSDGVLNRLQAMDSGSGPPGPNNSGGNSSAGSWAVRHRPGSGSRAIGSVDEELIGWQLELVALC